MPIYYYIVIIEFDGGNEDEVFRTEDKESALKRARETDLVSECIRVYECEYATTTKRLCVYCRRNQNYPVSAAGSNCFRCRHFQTEFDQGHYPGEEDVKFVCLKNHFKIEHFQDFGTDEVRQALQWGVDCPDLEVTTW